MRGWELQLNGCQMSVASLRVIGSLRPDFPRWHSGQRRLPVSGNAAVGLWLASVTVLLFSGLLVFDTWRLRNFYGPDEYVGAAVQIYLDLLNIFMAVLRVMGNRRN